jgi:hypothetical protein
VRRLDRVERLAGVVGSVGMVMIMVWALAATIGDERIVVWTDAMLDRLGALLSALELVANTLGVTADWSSSLLARSAATGQGSPDAQLRCDPCARLPETK